MIKKTISKQYESQIDFNNQQAVAQFLSEYFGVGLKPTPKFFPADYVSEDESVYVEVRCRTCDRKQFPNFLISGVKIINLLRLRFDELEPMIYLAVAWRDALGLIKIDFGLKELVPFHRCKSEGTYKSDVMVSIPVSDFKIISSGLKLSKSKNWMD